MCRLLLVQSKKPIKPKVWLTKFADMAKKSKALDGDWQGDGWGVAWMDAEKKWRVKTSLLPIWEERKSFDDLEEVSIFVAHARSASFPQHKGIIEFNQPYIAGKYAFVFNGVLKGVPLSHIPGTIGAEKIWYVLQKKLQRSSPQEALENIKELLIKRSKDIIALNIGLATPDNIYSLCYYTQHPAYYQLHYFANDTIKIVCSEDIGFTGG